MECPFCQTPLPDDDVFCEACGKQLHPPAQPVAEGTGCTCGAPPDEIAEDGYCGRCGHLARRPASDHVEMILSADFAGVSDHVEMILSADFAGVSDRGLKHQRNEDRFAMRQVGEGYVLVVCDGVSSTAQSELASSLVAEHVANLLEGSLRRHSASSPERTVRTAIHDAQDRLVGEPSTTVVAALVNGMDATIGWAGDSRAYWIGDDGEAQQLTADHSWMNEVVSSGVMSLEEAAHAPQAHGITRWLGADAGENAQPDVIHFRFPHAGHLMLCTDGLWNYAQEAKQLGALLHGAATIEMARQLVDYANAQGGHDNITAVLLRVDSPGND